MPANLPRLSRDYWRAASPMLAYAVLGLIWLAVWHQFFAAMEPRFGHLGPGGMAINDRPCECPECDFSGFWPAGLLVRMNRGADAYQTGAFLDFRHHVFSPAAELVRWFYPPPTLLPSALISYLPFEIGFVVWSVVFTLAAIWFWRAAELRGSVVAAGALSPAALWNLELGQFGAVMAGVLVCGLLLAPTRRFRAGAVLGLLVFKPQYGLLVPVILLAGRNFRAIAGCVLVVAGILAATTLVCGWQAWQDYLTYGLATSRLVLDAPWNGYDSRKFGISVFWMLRNFGAGLELSNAVQAVAAVLAACAAWAVWRSSRPAPVERMALTVFLSLLATPYGYTDDMVAWSVALAALAQRRGWRIDLLDALFWLWPALCPVIVMQTGLLLTPLVVLMAAARTWARCGAGGGAGRYGSPRSEPAALAAARR